MMKTKLLLSFLLLNLNFSLEATIVETIIFENPKNSVEVALFGSVHDEKGDEQFSKIYRTLLQRKEPLLILNEARAFSDNSFLWYRSPYYKFLMKFPCITEEISKRGAHFIYANDATILNRIEFLNNYHCFPGSISYKAVDYRFASWCLSSINNAKDRESFLTYCKYHYDALKKADFTKEVFKELEDPSLEIILQLIKETMMRPKTFAIPKELEKIFAHALNTLENGFSTIEQAFYKSFTNDIMKTPWSKIINAILKVEGVRVFLSNAQKFHLNTFSVVMDLEIINDIYTTDHKKIAVFADIDHTRNLAQWLLKLGWKAVHVTKCPRLYDPITETYDVPLSDFDFLK